MSDLTTTNIRWQNHFYTYEILMCLTVKQRVVLKKYWGVITKLQH